MAYNNFVVKNGLTVNGSFTANSTVVNAAALTATSVTTTTNNATIGTAAYFVANGNIGVGTASPASPLHVVGALRAGAGPSDATNAVGAIYNDGAGISIEAFQGNSSTTKRNLWLNAYGANVGIGTTTPDAKLAVTGTANVSGNVIIGGTATVTGNVTLGSSAFFVGNGVSITTLNATNITTGTLPDARLSSAVVNTSGNFTISGTHTHAGDITLNNNWKLNFKAVSGAGVSLTQQNDDNFVFYTTNSTGGARGVYSIFANSNTSAFFFAVPLDINTQSLSANGTTGSYGQLLTSNGSATFWSSTANNSTNLNGQAASYYLNATNLASGTVPTARLATTGTASSSTYLRGDQTWASAVTSVANGAGLVGGIITTTGTLSLPTTGPGAAAYSGGISSITLDAYGRVTALGSSAGYVTSSGVTSVANGAGLSGGTITTTGTLSLTSGIATPGTYSSGVSSITVDTYGRVTSVTGSGNYQAALGYTPANKAGDTFTGNIITTGSALKAGNGEAGEKQLYLHNNNRNVYFYLAADGINVGLWDSTLNGNRLIINSSGDVSATGTVISDKFRFKSDGDQDTGIDWDSDGIFKFMNNNVKTGSIDYNGNLTMLYGAIKTPTLKADSLQNTSGGAPNLKTADNRAITFQFVDTDANFLRFFRDNVYNNYLMQSPNMRYMDHRDWGGTEAMLVQQSDGTNQIFYPDAYSDARFKTNIQPSKLDALSAINAVDVVEYDWNEDGLTVGNIRSELKHVEIGVIGQQAVEHVPEMFEAGPMELPNGNTEYRFVFRPDKAVPYLIRAMQQQQELIVSLTERLEALELAIKHK